LDVLDGSGSKIEPDYLHKIEGTGADGARQSS
jgi:hypothetical protein